MIVTGAEPFTLENPLESATNKLLTCATSTPSVTGVDEEELEESSTVELLVTLVELREMASLPSESWIA